MFQNERDTDDDRERRDDDRDVGENAMGSTQRLYS